MRERWELLGEVHSMTVLEIEEIYLVGPGKSS